MAKTMHTTSKFSKHTINTIFVALIGVFMLIAPFYRGLFFRPNYITAIIFVSFLFTIFMLVRLKSKNFRILDTYLDVSVFLIPVAYLIAFFFAVNAKDAFDMFLLYCSYFFVYKLASELSGESEKFKSALINVVIASTFILSFTSMLHLAGLINIKGAFSGNRLFGLYQYANTSASVLGVGIILSLNKLIIEENVKIKAVYQMILTALVPSFIFTLSRGGYLVLSVVLLLNFIMVRAKAKVRLLMGLFVTFLSSSFFIYKYYTMPQGQLSAIWVQYLISIIGSAIILYIFSFVMTRFEQRFTDKSINAILTIISVVFIGAAIFLLTAKGPAVYRIEHLPNEEKSWKYELINLNDLESKSEYVVEFDTKASIESPSSYGILIRSYNSQNDYTDIINHFESVGPELTHKTFRFAALEDTERVEIFLYNYETNSFTEYRNVVIKDSNDKIIKKMEQLKYIPKDIAARLLDINLTTENASLRIYFAKDGLKIIKDYPLVGAGGGAWRNLYRQYQSVPYNTSEVHNFYVQYGTEVGIIGLADLIALLILLVISMIKSLKNGSNYLYVYLAAMLLFLHSTIDFNLSLSAVAYMLWMLIGILSSDKNTPSVERLPHKQLGALVLALAFVVLISATSIYFGMRLGFQGAISSQEKKEVSKTIGLYERAVTLDKYNGVYRIDLVQIMNNEFRKTKDPKYYDAIMEQISLLRKYEPYNHEFTPRLCNTLLSLGKLEEASKLADAIVVDEPMIVQSYKIKTDVNYEIADYYLKNNQVKEAVPYLESVVEAKDKLDEINTSLETPIKLEGDYPKKFDAAARALEMIKTDK